MAIAPEDAAVAARLVLAPRATMLPAAQQEDEAPPPPPDKSEQSESDSAERPDADSEMVLEAVRAAIPPGLLEQLGRGHCQPERAV